MSEIVYDTINGTYPVAGQDNDTQGFRDNFTIIKTGLSVANSEITSLETRSVLKVSNTVPPAVVNNDLLGSTIQNGLYYNMRGVIYENDSATGPTAITINPTVAPFQIFTLKSDVTFKFGPWPSGEFNKIRIHLSGDNLDTWMASFTAYGLETLRYSSTMAPSNTLTMGATTTIYAVDVWSYDGNDKVFIDLAATFTLAPP